MPRRDKPAPTPPASHRLARHAEQASQRRGTTEPRDDIGRLEHALAPSASVAVDASDAEVTHVNDAAQDAPRVRDALKAIRKRAGLSARSLGNAAGMPATTYKSYEDRYAKPHLPADLVRRIAPHLIGRGAPPVTQAELNALAGIVDVTQPARYTAATSGNARLDRPVSAPAATARTVPVLDARSAGWGVQSVNFAAEPLDWLPRPAALSPSRAVWALTMLDATLSPRFEPGERIYCDAARPPTPGGYAVVVTKAEPDGNALAFVGRLVRITETEVVLAHLNPAREKAIPAAQVETIARILTIEELLGG